jgi:hypothetical protein
MIATLKVRQQALILLTIIGLGGCVSSGREIDSAAIDRFVVDQTTEREVIAALGQPTGRFSDTSFGLHGIVCRSSFPASVHPFSISVRVCRRAHGGCGGSGSHVQGFCRLGLASSH